MRSLCSVDGCNRTLCSNGYCQLHLRRWKKTGSVELEVKLEYPKLCLLEGCSKDAKTKGLCSTHYLQDLRANETRKCSINDCNRRLHSKGLCSYHYTKELDINNPRFCTIEGCSSKLYTNGLCRSHQEKVAKDNRTINDAPQGNGHINKQGYREFSINDCKILEHRYVMEQSLGRLLVDSENVHHINGDRLDNRIENLELWSTSQPYGQRVVDKIKWARELIEAYDSNDLGDDLFGRY